jgi:hypothetical protein
MNVWLVRWGGRITRDNGTAYVLACDEVTAEEKFMQRHPHRRVDRIELLGSVIQ